MVCDARALSIDEIRNIIRRHPVEFAAIGNAGFGGLGEASQVAAQLLLSNPAILTEILVAGSEHSPETAQKMGFFRWIAALDILSSTAAEIDPQILIRTISEELGSICQSPGGALQ